MPARKALSLPSNFHWRQPDFLWRSPYFADIFSINTAVWYIFSRILVFSFVFVNAAFFFKTSPKMVSSDRQANVLLVDDELSILIPLQFLVEQQGYTVFLATNGEEALALTEKIQPQIVVLDVMMPGMDGFEVATRIRANPALDHVRVIFLTAKGTQSDRFKGYESGGEVYITKPFDNEDLVNTINEVHQFG